MKIQSLSTGTVRLKDAFLHPRPGIRRQTSLFLPGRFSPPLPIHLWLVEHAGRRILVDAGEQSNVHDAPFSKFEVGREEELPGALAGVGLEPGDLDAVVVTHMHCDHIDGAVHVKGASIFVSTTELAYSKTARARFIQIMLRQPIPAEVTFEPLELDDGPLGAFAASKSLTRDGRVAAVATPGHTPGHISVLCIDDHGRHILLGGDATDSLEQLRARRHDAVGPKPAITIATTTRILAHAENHPLVYLPSHDPESAARLTNGTTV